MNTKVKTAVGIALFVILIVAAYISYTILIKQYRPDTTIQIQNSSSELTKDENTSSKVITASSPDTNKYSSPDFMVYDQNGNTVKLSDFSGKPIVLNFWASWCPPCKSEMPHFNEVYAEYKNDVVFIMVDLVDGQRETQAKGLKYINDQKYSFPVYFDNKQSAADAFEITSIPATFFINADGNIVKAYEGAIDKNTLIAGINLIKK